MILGLFVVNLTNSKAIILVNKVKGVRIIIKLKLMFYGIVSSKYGLHKLFFPYCSPNISKLFFLCKVALSVKIFYYYVKNTQ
ncbi:hypothetical protein SAMN05421797_109109 [Maribacter ulvicola]|uniref:Uncharacterized protein n=1 Tax=Maribacter ulvicola TaxID=228959 RepID=A0A1N6ZSX5_9FLAO|nr:hypothetical protein SAMN05421797_109109 [Maribacter ulvicola]